MTVFAEYMLLSRTAMSVGEVPRLKKFAVRHGIGGGLGCQFVKADEYHLD